MQKGICIAVACLMIAAVLSGCGLLQKLGILRGGGDELRPASSIVMGEEEAKKLTDKLPIRLYFANEDNTRLKLEIRYIPITEAKKSTSSLATAVVNELINGPGTGSGLKPTIPEGTKLRAPVAVNAGIATVDLTKEFVDKHPGGKAAEQITLFSIVNSLTELKDIQKVKFLIEGKSRKEYKGNFQFDALFPRSPSLISNEPVPQGTGSSGAADAKEGGGDPGDLEDTYQELEEGEILE